MGIKDDTYWMECALGQAKRAGKRDEIPIGAVVVYENQLIARGFNRPISSNDPTAHAEMIALRAAARKLKNYRLEGCTLYVTVEPCAMCAAAASHARLARLVFATKNVKTGALLSRGNLLGTNMLLRKFTIESGLKSNEARQLLQSFFLSKRPPNK